MYEILAVIALVVVVVAAVWGWRRATDAAAPGPRRTAWEDDAGAAGGTRVVLDLAGADPDDPAVQRLVVEAAHRVLAADHSIDEVEVVARDGTPLGREHRPDPVVRDVAIPEALREPHAPTRHGPSAVPSADVGHPRHIAGPAPEVRAAPLADRLDLPAAVRAQIHDPDRATDVLRAILAAAGRPVQVDGDLVVSGDTAIAVIDPRGDSERALNHGFLRIQATDAPRGMILRLGYVDPTLLRRREAAAPHVRHVGADALQRMADAAVAGGDPIAFAAGPVRLR
jgi:hypothetical protein